MPDSPKPPSRAARVVVAALVAAIATATLWPLPGMPQADERYCIICGSLGGVDFLANVGLFVPLGLALRAAGVPLRRSIALGAGLSLAVEALQWRLIPGRDASAGDLLSNSIGSALGAAAYPWLPVLWRPLELQGRRLAAGWALLATGIGAIGAWSLRPAPVDMVYWSQWEPVRGRYTSFDGHLIGLGVQGRPRPNGVQIDPTREDAAYGAGLLDVRALLRPGSPAGGTKLIVRVGNPLGEELELAQRGRSLLVRTRRNASRLALRSPTLVVEEAFPPELSPAALHLEARHDAVIAALGPPREERPDTIRLTLGMAWRTVTPFEVHSATPDPLLRGAVLTALLLPIAWWGMVGLGIAGGLAAAGMQVLVLLWVVPMVAQVATGGIAELAGAVLGIAVGAALALRPARTSDAAERRSR